MALNQDANAVSIQDNDQLGDLCVKDMCHNTDLGAASVQLTAYQFLVIGVIYTLCCFVQANADTVSRA